MMPLTASRMVRNTFVAMAVVIGAGAIAAGVAASPDHKLIEQKPTTVVVQPFGTNPGDCPTEDSCKPDYTGGRWVIGPQVP